ncbi:hypothetical protein E2C01_055272 [Portunus trituberculatus]|uniref:Uncharacterized protein n=1 Tax=Portunus trituberculatus TaxID=210409 RepID=A0A5B7GUD2_PORTR|nr:hypothetical protein [Portunus trituberculatus]
MGKPIRTEQQKRWGIYTGHSLARAALCSLLSSPQFFLHPSLRICRVCHLVLHGTVLYFTPVHLRSCAKCFMPPACLSKSCLSSGEHLYLATPCLSLTFTEVIPVSVVIPSVLSWTAAEGK